MYSDPNLFWIRMKLGQWGRLCRVHGLGYPSMAAIERAIFGRGGRFSGPSLPQDLEEIDWAVSRSPVDYKIILVESYTKNGTWDEHAARLMLPKTSYFRRKLSAERHIYETLKSGNAQVPFETRVAI